MITGFKTQLKGVLANAVSYFQDSGDPNEACVKAANEAGFNADQADRLVETFNTARVICHYKAAEDKTSSCSLADKDTVRRGLTAQPETKAAEASFDDYDFYKQAEVDHVVPEVKVAAAEPQEEPISKEAASWLEERENLKVRELMKTAEEEARLARSTADMIAEKVAHAISRNVSLDDVHDKVARLVTAYAGDDRYYPGVEKVGEFIPAASDPDAALLGKYAKMHVVPTDDLAPFLPAIKEAADFVAEAAALDAYRAEMEKIAQEARVTVDSLPDDKDKLESLLLKHRIVNESSRAQSGGEPAAKPSGGGGGGKSPALSTSGTVSFVTNLRDLLKGTVDQKAQARVNKATDGVNNVRRQLILQDLIVNDKILSQEDPNAVAAAFRSVHQVSPDTTLNKEMLRSMLRSAVQSVAISPYDAKTLVDVDKARRQAYDQKAPKGGDNA